MLIEIFEVKNALAPEIVKGIHVESNQNHYNLQNQSFFRRPLMRTIYQGSESISYLVPKIWDINPEKLKETSSVDSFKKSVRKRIPKNCPCSALGFL